MIRTARPSRSGPPARGQSEILGLVLVIGIVMLGVTSLLLMGTSAMSDATARADVSNAENTLSQFDSEASRVALGPTDSQRVEFPHDDDGRVEVNGSAGTIRILVADETGETTVVDTNLGAISYEFDDTTLAYQGGGVWRHRAGKSVMVSPPEFHYKDQTLTFPIIRVSGDSGSVGTGGQVLIRETGSVQHFPTAARSNPLESGHIHVEVTSRYHYGWKSYFESRTEGAVTHYPANQTVSVNLTVPVTESFDSAISATSNESDAITHHGSPHGGFGSPQETGANKPSASPRVDDEISACLSSGCDDLVSEQSDGVLENGTYYAGGDVAINETTYDTSSGSIDVVVNGDLTFAGGGGPGTTNHEVTGDGSVTYYVKGNVNMSGNTGVNTNGQSEDLLVLVHSNGGDVTVSGTAQYTGLIYAPNSSLTINGGGCPCIDNVVGAAVVRDATANGNGDLVFEHPESFEMEFETVTDITFLHVTENELEVTGG